MSTGLQRQLILVPLRQRTFACAVVVAYGVMVDTSVYIIVNTTEVLPVGCSHNAGDITSRVSSLSISTVSLVRRAGGAVVLKRTRRPASADRTARRQFQATGQLVSRTQASDAMTSLLPHYEPKCVQRRCFQCRSVPLRSDIKERSYPRPIY